MIQENPASAFSADQFHFPSDDSRGSSSITKDDHGRIPFFQRVIRYGHGKDPRHERTNHKHDKTEIYLEQSSLKITNKTCKTITFGRTGMMGVVDLRSLGFYKIKQEVLQEHLSRHYHFKLADNVCDQYNRLVNLMRKEEEKSEGKFPWLDATDKRKYMTDREILDKYVNLDNSCLTKVEKEQVRDLLYQYKDAFSLRDEIGLCPNIEIEIDVMDKSPFFIRPFHANEDDKAILDKEMK